MLPHSKGMTFEPRILKDLVTLFVVVNPIGLVPLYLAVVGSKSPEAQRRIALRATLIAFVILVGFVVAGQIVLNAMDIPMTSFRIGGGLVLLILGLRMVLQERAAPESKIEESGEAGRDVAVFPLAMPFIGGPGTIMTVVLLTDHDTFSVLEQAETVVLLSVVLAFTYAAMRLAPAVLRWIGETGVNIVTRVMGLILTAMAVESILMGIQGHFGK